MNLTFLGTGTSFSKAPVNFNNNAMIRAKEEDKPWLIDCGLTAPQALFHLGLSVGDLTGVLITHLHGDHIYGLEEAGFFNFFVKKRKMPLWLPDRLLCNSTKIRGEDLWDRSLRGSMESVHGVKTKFTLDDYFDVQILYLFEPVEIQGVQVEIFEVPHVPGKPSYGVILNGEIAYTSDCVYVPAMIEGLLGEGCKRIFHDAYFGSRYPHQVHASYDDLAQLPLDIRERITIMHYNDSVTRDQLALAMDAGFKIARREMSPKTEMNTTPLRIKS